MQKRILICTLFILSANIEISLAQLSGSYTIGGTLPDYNSFYQAMAALNSQGVSGPVIFNIRPGTYHEHVTLNFVNGTSDTNTVTIQSETLDSSSVIIEDSCNCHIIVFGNGAHHFILKELTMTNTFQYVLSEMYDVQIENCVISSSSQWALDFWGGANSIINSVVNGKMNCTMSSTPTIIYGNIMNGDMDCDKINCRNNKIFGILTAVTDCDVEQNEIHGYTYLLYAAIVFKNNIIYPGSNFQGGIDVSYSGGGIIDNEVHGTLDLAFADHSNVIGNKIFGDFDLSQSDYCLVANNFFYNNVDVGICHYCSFVFNNCALDSNQYFWLQGCLNTTIKNNILPSDFHCDYPLSNTIVNNDYPATGDWDDSHPFHIDPSYLSSTDLHISNPQLLGKGVQFSTISYDIDSLHRPNPPSIGANEFCISPDTLNIFCGDSVILSLCSMPASGYFTWSPSAGINSIHLARPTISVAVSHWYSVTDSISGYSDSVYVNVTPFNINAGNDLFISCGDNVTLSSTYNAGAAYQWTPTTGLSNPNSNFTDAGPTQTITYVVTAIITGCSVSSDTVTVNVNPLPRASAAYNFSGLTATFFNFSTCATDYYWYFGDGDSSTLFAPVHTYPYTGMFLVTLIACNSFGCDTIRGYVIVIDVGIQELDNLVDLKCFPNPTNGNLSLEFETKDLNPADIRIQIADAYGREIVQEQLTSFKGKYFNNYNLSTLSNGIYILRLTIGNDFISRKIILAK